jgi:hypothetical protein
MGHISISFAPPRFERVILVFLERLFLLPPALSADNANSGAYATADKPAFTGAAAVLPTFDPMLDMCWQLPS